MKKPIWQVGPVGVIVGVRLMLEVISALKIVGWQAQLKYWSGMVGGNVLIALGWTIGWLVVDLDKYLARYKSKLGENTFLLEQWPAGVKNVLTALALVIAGIWVTTSTGNLLAMGLVLGLQVRLFSLMYLEVDYKKWFWVFSRSFSQGERNLFLAIWAILLIVQGLFVIRT